MLEKKGRTQMQKRVPVEPGRGLFLVLFLVSGFTGVVFEVVSSKLLGLMMGNSIYSITTVVTTFMAGLALGSFLADRIVRGRRPLVVYGLLEAGVAAACLAFPFALDLAQPLLKYAYTASNESFGSSTAEMPPCAQVVAASERPRLVTIITSPCSAAARA